MAKPQKSDLDKYISGIYNYCDRWCERCSMTEKCYLYAEDQKRIQVHLKKGEDPYDMDIVIKDIEENFKNTFKMIRDFAEEEGIDLDDLSDVEYKEPVPEKHPVFQLAHRYFMMANKYLKKIRDTIQEFGIDLSKKIQIFPSTIEHVDRLKEVGNCYEVILWYHTLISAKVYRALCSTRFGDDENKDELDEVDIYDSDGSAKVAYISIIKSLAALRDLHTWFEEIDNKELQDETLSLLVVVDKLRRMVDSVFPGHKDFKRPGFDD
ncbi:hypothetical protein JXI42_08045 [bacterium]|nr:hypothetical protein [bacterium]